MAQPLRKAAAGQIYKIKDRVLPKPDIKRAASMLELASEAVKRIIIEGITENGRQFRPSDWAERMSGALSTFGRDHRIQYSPLLQPLTVNGIKCVSVDPHLKDTYPEMFAYIMRWVDMNRLKVTEVDSDEPSKQQAAG